MPENDGMTALFLDLVYNLYAWFFSIFHIPFFYRLRKHIAREALVDW